MKHECERNEPPVRLRLKLDSRRKRSREEEEEEEQEEEQRHPPSGGDCRRKWKKEEEKETTWKAAEDVAEGQTEGSLPAAVTAVLVEP